MPSADLLVASTAVHFAAATLFGTLWLLRRGPEHRAFAQFALAVGVFAGANAAIALVDSPSMRPLAARASWCAGTVAAALLVHFCVCLVPSQRHRFTPAVYALAVIAAALTLFGPLFVDDGGVRFGPVAGVTTALSFAVAGFAAWVLVRAARQHREARMIGMAALAALALAAIDEITRWQSTARYGLSIHGGTLLVCAASVVLLQRFAATTASLRRETAALEAATTELERTRQEQVRKGQLAALGELSASVAHEVRNPLAIMKNAISGMKRPTLEEADRATLLAIVVEETDRLGRLVRDLLAFARPRRETDETTQLRPLVERAVADVTGGMRRAQTSLSVDVRVPNALAVSGDAELLRLAVSNVVENALHAMPQGGVLTIDARALTGASPPTIEILFRDEGEGMDPTVLEKALDPFFTTRAAGTGLGLAIVDNVVRSHGGDVTLESEPGFGTTVCIRVPLVRPTA